MMNLYALTTLHTRKQTPKTTFSSLWQHWSHEIRSQDLTNRLWYHKYFFLKLRIFPCGTYNAKEKNNEQQNVKRQKVNDRKKTILKTKNWVTYTNSTFKVYTPCDNQHYYLRKKEPMKPRNNWMIEWNKM